MKSIYSILIVVLLLLFSAGCMPGGVISDPLTLDLPNEILDPPTEIPDSPLPPEDDPGEPHQLKPLPEVYSLAPKNFAGAGNNTRSINLVGFIQPTVDIPKLNDVDPDDDGSYDYDLDDELVDCSNFSETGVIDTCKTVSCANDGDIDEFNSCRESDDLQITCSSIKSYVKSLPACEARADEMICLGMQCMDEETAERLHGDKLEELCETQRREKEDLINNSGCWVNVADEDVVEENPLAQRNERGLPTSDRLPGSIIN
jgi:hypothetical protein